MICTNPTSSQRRKIGHGFAPGRLGRPVHVKMNRALTEDEEDVRDAKAALRRNDFISLEDFKKELGL